MDYWKSKVMPKIKKVFDQGGKKAAAAEIIKSFDESKEAMNSEFEEKKGDLQAKVLEIYEAAPARVKTLVKERKLSGIKKNSAVVTKFIEELAKIDFPGAKQISEGTWKVGAALLSGPIFATFEKVSSLLPTAEEAPKEGPVAGEEVPREVTAGKKKEEAPEAEEKKEEAPVAEEEATEAPAVSEPAAAAAPAETDREAARAEPEPAKTEEEPPKV